MASMTRLDLVHAAQAAGHRYTDALAVLEALLALVVRSVACGQAVEIRGFGTFYAKEFKPRPARNPRTGDVVMLPRRKVMLCRLSPQILRGCEKSPGRLDADDKKPSPPASVNPVSGIFLRQKPIRTVPTGYGYRRVVP